MKEDARTSYAELARAIEDCTDEELLRKREGRDGLVWEVVPPNGHLHLGEHLAFWHQAHGDEPAAEASQLWMLGVHEAAFSEAPERAFGAYNLGCYYAKLGRSADAVPHLARSFELHPDLKAWALKDKDLDRIRKANFKRSSNNGLAGSISGRRPLAARTRRRSSAGRAAAS